MNFLRASFFLMILAGAMPLLSIRVYAELPTAPSIADDSEMQMPKKKFVSDKGKILEVGDRIHVKVYPEDPYLKDVEMEISSEGNVILPLVGKVEIAGMPIIEAEKKLVQLIDQDYIVNPEVIIEVQTVEEVKVYNKMSISVLGAVRAPGNYDVDIKSGEAPTLIQAVLKAGGFSDIANIRKIKIVRKSDIGENEVLRANAEDIVSGKEQDIALFEGDIVHVSESLF